MVCEAVDVLTRRSGETYTDYIRRLCAAPGPAGETARLVKVADFKVGSARTDVLRERYEWGLPPTRRTRPRELKAEVTRWCRRRTSSRRRRLDLVFRHSPLALIEGNEVWVLMGHERSADEM